MNRPLNLWIDRACSNPSFRPYMVNKGTMFLYCDYAGFASRHDYGVACCAVFNRTVKVTAKKLPIERDRGSNYGEILAIALSLDTLAALPEQQPKAAVIFTDCSRISRILAQDRYSNPHDGQAVAELTAALAKLNRRFPEVGVQIRYIRKHKRNNPFHRLAHDAARQAAMSSVGWSLDEPCIIR
ncbi:hypothetical protein [Paenibacillus arenilitoris]|uniref:Uncharacterized protein n=1 Tax=Paenibacillus arenilitoris TaxID=2772299 RepID=A0A927HA49_9BACL|nr:hypothetical protein [Paenibacillus arenilitoris]MBD2872269.1 hypothetical protein [Paenibacillus arenilitoris]